MKKDYLQMNVLIIHLLEISSNGIKYKGVSAKTIVFCEGFGVLQNPFFNYLPKWN